MLIVISYIHPIDICRGGREGRTREVEIYLKKMNIATDPNDFRKHVRFDPSISQESMSQRQPPKSLTLAFSNRHNKPF